MGVDRVENMLAKPYTSSSYLRSNASHKWHSGGEQLYMKTKLVNKEDTCPRLGDSRGRRHYCAVVKKMEWPLVGAQEQSFENILLGLALAGDDIPLRHSI